MSYEVRSIEEKIKKTFEGHGDNICLLALSLVVCEQMKKCFTKARKSEADKSSSEALVMAYKNIKRTQDMIEPGLRCLGIKHFIEEIQKEGE